MRLLTVWLPLFLIVVVCGAWFISVSLLREPAFQPGDRVTVIRWNAPLWQGDVVVGRAAVGDDYEVERVVADRLLLRGKTESLDCSDVVPFVRAVDHFTNELRRNPEFTAYYNRGVILEKRGDIDLAIQDFNEAIRLHPGSTEAHLARSRLYEARGDHDRAIADCSDAIRLDPQAIDCLPVSCKTLPPEAGL